MICIHSADSILCSALPCILHASVSTPCSACCNILYSYCCSIPVFCMLPDSRPDWKNYICLICMLHRNELPLDKPSTTCMHCILSVSLYLATYHYPNLATQQVPGSPRLSLGLTSLWFPTGHPRRLRRGLGSCLGWLLIFMEMPSFSTEVTELGMG